MIPYLPLQALNAAYEPMLSDAVQRVVQSGWYLNGKELAAFEQEFAAYLGVAHCVGVGNGLDALTLILLALREMEGWDEGDEVIVPAMTFVASAEAVVRAGLRPVLCDVDETALLNAAQIEPLVSPHTRALLPVHLYGKACDMNQLKVLAHRHGLRIVEDAAQAHGATYADGRRVGTGGDAAAFSFYPGKNLGALGDGGAVVTDDAQLAALVREYANYGAAKKYEHRVHGCNSRLDELQAAVLRTKLPHLDAANARRQTLAQLYDAGIQNPAVHIPYIYKECSPSVYHIYPILSPHRDALQSYLRNAGVECLIHYPHAIHQQQAFSSLAQQHFPQAERFAAQVLSLPLHPLLTDEEAHTIIRLVNAFRPENH